RTGSPVCRQASSERGSGDRPEPGPDWTAAPRISGACKIQSIGNQASIPRASKLHALSSVRSAVTPPISGEFGGHRRVFFLDTSGGAQLSWCRFSGPILQRVVLDPMLGRQMSLCCLVAGASAGEGAVTGQMVVR